MKRTLILLAIWGAIWTPVLLHDYLKDLYVVGTDFLHDNGGTSYLSVRVKTAYHHKLDLPHFNMTIHSVPPDRVTEECCKDGCRQDDGQQTGPGTAQACMEKDLKTGHVDIWVTDDDHRPVLLHELAHADGSYSDAEVERMFP